MIAEIPRLLMVVGSATPPGRLAAAIAAAAETVRSDAEDINVDFTNLAEPPIDTCDGRPLDGYAAETRQAVGRIAAAAAVLIAVPVYRAGFPGGLKDLVGIVAGGERGGEPGGVAADSAASSRTIWPLSGGQEACSRVPGADGASLVSARFCRKAISGAPLGIRR